MKNVLIWGNLLLIILFPIAWFAPLMRAGLLPLFSLDEISVASGILSLLGTDILLAFIVLLFAIIAPILKTVALSFVHFNILPSKTLPVLSWLGKLAMADIFLIALYIVVAKGIGVGRLEVGWGLYLFTACVVMSLLISALTSRFVVSDVSKYEHPAR